MRRRQALALCGSALLGGCGYALVGKGTVVDPDIKRIGVPLFKDGTGRGGLDQKVTQKVIEELLKRGRFDVVQETTGVNAIVEGELTSYRPRPLGITGDTTAGTSTSSQANRYELVLTARVKYYKVGQKDNPIWSSDAFSYRDEYDVGDDPNAFFDREDQSIERLTTLFARNLVSQMLEAF